MKILLLLPLLLGLMSPAIAHNENNGGCDTHCESNDVTPRFGIGKYLNKKKNK